MLTEGVGLALPRAMGAAGVYGGVGTPVSLVEGLGDGLDTLGAAVSVGVGPVGLGLTSARAMPVSIVSASAAVAAMSSGRRGRTFMTLILSVSAANGGVPSV